MRAGEVNGLNWVRMKGGREKRSEPGRDGGRLLGVVERREMERRGGEIDGWNGERKEMKDGGKQRRE